VFFLTEQRVGIGQIFDHRAPSVPASEEKYVMSDYRVDEHRVEVVDVVGSWLIAAIVVTGLFVLILPSF
jgi:hypothetical protein